METVTTLRVMKDNELAMLRQRAVELERIILSIPARNQEPISEIENYSGLNCVCQKKMKREKCLKKILEYMRISPGADHREITALNLSSNTGEYLGILVARKSIRKDAVNREKHYYPV